MIPIESLLHPRRLRALLIAVVLGYVGFIAWAHYQGFQKAAHGERPLFTDFTSTYGAALLLRDEAAENLYLPEHMIRATGEAGNAAYGGTLTETQRKVGFTPWVYPPTFIAFVLPLALMPYFAAYLFWLAFSALPYVMAIRAIMDEARIAVWVALAAPPFFYLAMFGQTSLLPAGLIGLGLFYVRRNPWWAGILIGLASVKPHLGLLIPIALLAGGHWRVFLSASVTTVALVLASIAAFGMEPWYAFLGRMGFYMEGFEHGGYAWRSMTSALSVVHLSGGDMDRAWLGQAVSTTLAAAAVALVWWTGRRRPEGFNLQAAVLCNAIPLAFPGVHLYDLVILVVGLAFLLQDMKERGYRPWEAAVIPAAMLGILLVRPLGAMAGVHIGFLSVLLLFALALARYRSLLREAP